MPRKLSYILTATLLTLLLFSVFPKISFGQGTYSCTWNTNNPTGHFCLNNTQACDSGCNRGSCYDFDSSQSLCEQTTHYCNCTPSTSGSISWALLYDALDQTAPTPGGLITRLLLYLFPIAGLILLLYLIYGGYRYLTSAGNPKNVEAAKHIMSTALLGFVIIFTSFWIVQIVGRILGLTASVGSIFGTP